MVFEATTARVKDVILQSEHLDSIALLAEIPNYLHVLRETHIFTNPLVFGVVHLQILEELLPQVEKGEEVNLQILHLMDLLLLAIAGLSLGDQLEKRRDIVARFLSNLKNTHSLR